MEDEEEAGFRRSPPVPFDGRRRQTSRSSGYSGEGSSNQRFLKYASPEKLAAGALSMRSVVSASLASSFEPEVMLEDALSGEYPVDDSFDNTMQSAGHMNATEDSFVSTQTELRSDYGTLDRTIDSMPSVKSSTYYDQASRTEEDGDIDGDDSFDDSGHPWRYGKHNTYAQYYHTSRGRRAAYAFVTVQTCLALLLIVYDAWYSGYPPTHFGWKY